MQLLKKKSRFDATQKRELMVFEKFANVDRGETGTLVSYESRNCDCRNGKLQTGVGLKDHLLSDGEVGVPANTARILDIVVVSEYDSEAKIYRDRTYYITETGYTGCYNFAEKRFKLQLYTSPGMRIARFRNYSGKERVIHVGPLGVCGFNADYGVTTGTTEKVKPFVCAHRNRMFVAKDDRTVLCNSPLNDLQFGDTLDHGGAILCAVNEGSIVALESLGDYVYIFLERAIFRMEAVGSNRDFVLERLPYYGEGIVGGTVGAVGEYIVFLAKDGLWRLDSRSKETKRICESLQARPAADQTYSARVAFEGKLFIHYRDAKTDEYKTLAVYPDVEEAYFLFNTEGLSLIDGKAVCSDGFQFYEYDQEGLLPSWDSSTFKAKTDFGIEGSKVLRTLTIEGTGRVELYIETEENSVNWQMELDGKAELPVFERGKEFNLTFTLLQRAEVTKLAAEIQHWGSKA